MAPYCCQPNENTVILAYADGSNIRQFSNQASVDLAREGFGKLICLAGSRPNNGFTQSEKNPGHWEGSQKWGELEKVACLLYPLTATDHLAAPCLSIRLTKYLWVVERFACLKITLLTTSTGIPERDAYVAAWRLRS